jgi:hypothetical protein
MLRKINRIFKKVNIIKKRIKMININKNKKNDIYMIIYKNYKLYLNKF